MKTLFKYCVLILLLVSVFEELRAQNFYLEPQESETSIIGLKASIPVFKNNEYITYKSLSGNYCPYTVISLKKNWSLYSEVPIIIARSDYENETGLGNIFLAVRKNLNTEKTSRISFGAFLPTVGKEKYLVNDIGVSSNYYRLWQFVRAVTIYGNYAYHLSDQDNAIFGFEVGPDIFIPIDDNGDTELFFHFGAKAGYKLQKLWMWGEISNILLVSESDIDFKDRIISQLAFGGQLNFNRVKPGLFYTIPLKDYIRDYQNGMIGVKVDIGI